MTLAIPPKNAANILLIDVVWWGAFDGPSQHCVALFQDATASALAAVDTHINATHVTRCITFRHKMTAGTTSATTFKVRAGSNNAGTTTFNGAAGARKFGGIAASSITITEIAA